MASTYQRLSGGRLLVNIVTGAEPAELARFGIHDDKETRYAQTEEFIEIVRGAWSGTPFTFRGRTTRSPMRPPGTGPTRSRRSTSVARRRPRSRSRANHVDVYLAWGEPPAMVAERVERMRALASAAGRSLRSGSAST